MKRKKLLVDAHTFDENHQGIRTFMKGIYSALKIPASDLEVILIANDVENLKQEFKHQKAFNFVKLKHTNKYIRLAYEIPKLIKTLEVDFAHFNYFLPLFLSKKCKYIVTIHDVLFIDFPDFFPKKYQIINSFMYKRSARRAEIVTTVSQYSKDMILKNFGIQNKPITILPNAANELYWKPHNKAEDRVFIKQQHNLEMFIIFVSRFEPRKNHEILIQAFEELELWKSGYSLLFIGKETFKNEPLKNKIETINAISNESVVVLEDINNDLLVKFYNAAALSVFPSLCEGFGIPPIESAILKTPTLCSNVTAMSDFDFFGEFLFDPTDVDELKSKMMRALANYDEGKHEQISSSIKERYNWKHTAEVLKQLIINY